MSIWYNIGDREINGLDYETERPDLTIGVALTWWDHARVAIRSDDGAEPGTILLNPTELRRLAALLMEAADKCDDGDRDPLVANSAPSAAAGADER